MKKHFWIIFNILLANSFLQAEDTSNCSIDVTKLRKCPVKNLKIVPKNYQPQVLFLSALPVLSNVDFLKAVPDGTMIAVAGVHREGVVKDLKKKLSASEFKEIEKKLLFYPHHVSEKELKEVTAPEVDNHMYSYYRDLAVLGFDPVTGRIQYNFQKRDWHPDATELSLCGVPADMNDKGSRFFGENSSRGGNIMGFPGGKCLVGETMNHEKVLSLCGSGEGVEIIKIPTKGATVGHIDELVNILPSSDKAPCDFKIAIADQALHDDILRKNPKDLFFREGLVKQYKDSTDEYYSDPNNCQHNGCVARLPQARVCNLYQSYSILEFYQKRLGASYLDGHKVQPQKQSTDKEAFLNLIFDSAHAGAVPFGEEGETEEEREQRLKEEKERIENLIKNYPLATDEEFSRSIKKCSQLTNEDILKVMSVDISLFEPMKKFISDQDSNADNENVPFHKQLRSALFAIEGNIASNQKIKESLAKTRSILEQHVPEECREKAFVKMPYLFIEGKSVNPNPSNFEAFGDVVLTPEQITPAVEDYMIKTYKELGMKPFSMDTFSKHTGGGNVHCVTNELRLCAP